MKFGTDIDDDEQWLSKYFKLPKSFSLSSYSSIINTLSIVELLGMW